MKCLAVELIKSTVYLLNKSVIHWHLFLSVKCLLFFCSECFKTLRKKGFNGCNSPEPDGDDSIDQSPLQEDKYHKSQELDILFKRYGVSIHFYLVILTSLLFLPSVFLSHSVLEINKGSEQERAPGFRESGPRGAVLPHASHRGEVQKDRRRVW